MAQDSQQPRDWRDCITQGVALLRDARYAEAFSVFQKASELNPSSQIPHLYSGLSAFQEYIPGAESVDNAEHAQRAETEYRKALALDPNNWNAVVLLGHLLFAEQKMDEARACYTQMLAADPRSATASYMLGAVAWRVSLQGAKSARPPLVEEAITDFQKALELNPKFEDAMVFLSLMLRERAAMGEREEDRRQDEVAADRWIEKAADVKSAQVQAGYARTAVVLPEADGPDAILSQWSSLLASYPPPPPPPPPPSFLAPSQAGGELVASAVVSWERRPRGDEALPRIRVDASDLEQKVISKVRPKYPGSGENHERQVLRFVVVVGEDGPVVRETYISGNYWLIEAGVEALHQWLYSPTLVDGKTVEVVSEVKVEF
jgi:tetratricopeptide (TPR) repeat protein